MALSIMRANKKMLSSPKGIASLFERLSKTDEVAKLEKYLPCRLDEVVIGAMDSSIEKIYSMKQIRTSVEQINKVLGKVWSKHSADMVVDGIVDKKGEIVKIIKSVLPNDKIISNLEKAKTKEEMLEVLQTFDNKANVWKSNTIQSMLRRSGIKIKFSKNGYQVLPLEVLQEDYRLREVLGEAFLKLHKLINPISTNPEIVKIENLLKTEYGFEYAHFSNIEEAEKFLQAVKIHVKKGTPLPKAVSTSPFINDYLGKNMQINDGNIVFITPLEKVSAVRKDGLSLIEDPIFREYVDGRGTVFKKRLYSTCNPIHFACHEIEHNNGCGYGHFPIARQLFKIKQKKGKFKEVYDSNDVTTARKLGSYSEQNIDDCTEEIRTELCVKQMLEPQNFTADEQILLDFWS